MALSILCLVSLCGTVAMGNLVTYQPEEGQSTELDLDPLAKIMMYTKNASDVVFVSTGHSCMHYL